MIEWIKGNLLLIKIGLVALAIVSAFLFGWRQGSLNVQSQWDKEKAELNAQAAQKIYEANMRVRQLEADANKRVASIEANYRQQLRKKDDEKTIALRRAATGGLFINANCPSAGNPVPATSAGTGISDGTTRVELPAADAGFLITFAAEADQVAEQLTACQAILRQERQ